ncbi:Polysaccharide biosynthesis protein [Limihaloglobus sulfuriphilus]|uniref:Polysaccharide biosynthesis protein n=2 Tax=Limihaloglobus sulfuriphilus TaxID=1851148 RepID=A0A1Q2MGW7_9BACT|nr:Polysaccharide biosynthesis protein [Limihaloglobus sulfuriphilus]
MALLASIAIASALSRLLDKAEYGAFCQILMLFTMSSIIVRSGLPQSVYYFLPRLDEPQKRGLILQSVMLMAGFGFLVGLVLYLGSNLLGVYSGSELLPCMLRNYALYPVFILPIMVIESVFMSFNRIYTEFSFNVISKIIVFFVVVTPIYLGYSTVIAIRCWVIYAALQFFVLLIIVNGVTNTKKIELTRTNFISQFKYSVPLSLAAIIGAFAAYADKLSINILNADPELFASYFNGAFELPLVGVIGGAVTMTMLPSMTEYVKENRIDKFLSLWHRSQIKVAFILFPMWLFFFVFAKEIILVLFSDKYESSVVYFQIFLCLIPARLCVFSRITVPLNRNWIYTGGHLIQLIVGYVACFILIRRFGGIGAAIGMLISIYANVLFLAYNCSKLLNIRFYEIWPLRLFLVYFIYAVISGCAGWIVCVKFPVSNIYWILLKLLIGSFICGGMYLITTWITGVFNWREWTGALNFRFNGSSNKTKG